jgi:glycosyltransferase involved in cell wall biosynthesis
MQETIRVCLPIEFQPHGGGFYFLEMFTKYLLQSGFEVGKDIGTKYDILFTNHWMTPRKQILKAIRHNPGVRIVQRIDGSAKDYGRGDDADQRQAQVNRLADLTIFQSHYAKFATREKFKVVTQDGPVIYNPVDLIMFTPEGRGRPLEGNLRVICVSWSTNPYKGSSEIYAVARLNLDVDFYLCGNFLDTPELDNLHNLGVLDRKQLAEILRSCHALLTFSRNEACPNHVIEAMASGLPVLFLDSGAMKEIVADCGLAVTPDNFRVQLQAIHHKRNEFSIRARVRAESAFNPDKIMTKYVQEIMDSLNEPTRIHPLKRSVLAWTHLKI